MTRMFHTFFFWLPRFRTKTPLMQMMINIIIGASAIGAAVGIIFFIRRDINQRVADTREKLLLLRAAQERQTVFVNLNNDYKRLTPLFPAIYSILPRTDNVIMFADAIQAIAKETENTISFQFEANEPSPDPLFTNVAHVRFHAKVEGTGESFNRFLKRLETSRYLHSIDAITLDGPQGIYESVTASIKGTVFIKNDDIKK